MSQHAELGSGVRVYLASLSCLAMMMRKIAMATITVAAIATKGSVTTRVTVHSTAACLVETVTCGQ